MKLISTIKQSRPARLLRAAGRSRIVRSASRVLGRLKELSPIKLLDWYIIKKFLGTYIFAIILILAITIMFDINEKLDAFL